MDLFSNSIQRLASSGMITPDNETENEIRSILHLQAKTTPTAPTPPNNTTQEQDEIEPENEEEELSEDTAEHIALSNMLNNDMLSTLYSGMSASEARKLKKKGLKLNEYESQAPRQLTIAERKVNLVKLSEDIEE